MNNILKKETEFEILENDIFYKEGILEFLKINSKINIFFILEKQNKEFEDLLKEENIENIFYNEEINIDKFINKLKNVKRNNRKELEREIELLKNIISEKDEEILKYQNGNKINFCNKKIIVIVGEKNCGKSLILSNLQNIMKDEQNIKSDEFDFKELNINDNVLIKKETNYIYKFIFICELDLEKIKSNKKKIDKLIVENKINSKQINIIFNKINRYSINIKIAKYIFKEFNLIGKIKLNNYCNYLINKENNYKKENNKLIKQYLKIVKKL